MKRIALIVICVVCLFLGASIMSSRATQQNTHQTTSSQIISSEVCSEVSSAIDKIELNITHPIQTTHAEETTESVVQVESKKTTAQLSEQQSQTQKQTTRIQRIVEENNSRSNTANYVKDSYINEQINENINQIDQGDLEAGAAIYNRLDTNYIFSLADGGLTDQERIQLDDYMNSQLTPVEYDLVKNLYFKYVGLLNND